MAWRNEIASRCAACYMRNALCVCQVIPQLNLATKVVILMHKRELRTTTNTGRLALVSLKNSEMLVRGGFDEPDYGTLVAADRNLLLLYPDDDALVLSSEWVRSLDKPVTLFVPDGSWRQASKVSRRETAMLNIQKVKLPVGGAPSRYRLRREPKKEGLATFEAIARTLGILEGPEVQEQLEKLFLCMVERMLWSRGLLTAEECTYPIPIQSTNELSTTATKAR